MVIKTYRIPRATPQIYNYLVNLSTRQTLETQAGTIIVSIDHPDSADEITFKQKIANEVTSSIEIDGILENINRYLSEIQTDQLLYMSSRQVTKTNIGTTFVNLFTDFSGRPFFADLTGFTRLAFQTYWTKIGTGNQHLRIVDDSGAITSDLINTETLGTGTGLVTGDNSLANYSIPALYTNFKGKLRIQVRSTVAADDPVFEGINIYLRR